MWSYDKKLQYPVHITRPNPAMAKVIITQFGGPDGELSASTRYLSQRYVMPYDELKGLLTDIGTEGSEWSADDTAFRNYSTTNTHFCGRRFSFTSTRRSR